MTDVTIDFIYFDLGNVLLTFDHQTACQQVGELVSLPASKIWELLFASGLQARYERGEVTSGQFHEAFCAASGTRPDEAAFLLANAQIFRLNVPIVAIVGHLMAGGHRLGILSNTCAAHWDHISDGHFAMISRYFSTAVLSYREGASKPEPAIYRVAIERAGTEPSRIFFVDDRAENVEGARRAGLDAVLYRGPRQLAAELRGRGVRFNY